MELKHKFISFEGIDGSGKTSIVDLLFKRIKEYGIKMYKTREPLRDKQPWSELYDLFENSQRIDRFSEAFLLLSCRIDNVNRFIKPELERGSIILSDRYVDSWFAYQSLRLEEYFGSLDKSLDYLIGVHEKLVKEGILIDPDITLFLEVNPDISINRIKGNKNSKYEKLDFLRKISRQYLLIQEIFHKRIVKIDTNPLNLEEVYKKVLDNLDL